MLDVSKVYASGSNAWDAAVRDASEEYKHRMVNKQRVGCFTSLFSHHSNTHLHCVPSWKHNLCCDNCHSHVAMALNLMRYENSTSWNMVNLCALSLIRGKHVRWEGATFLELCSLWVDQCDSGWSDSAYRQWQKKTQTLTQDLICACTNQQGRTFPLFLLHWESIWKEKVLEWRTVFRNSTTQMLTMSPLRPSAAVVEWVTLAVVEHIMYDAFKCRGSLSELRTST